MSTPYIGFSNTTLNRQPLAKAGDEIICPRCAEKHVLSGADSTDGARKDLILFYECDEKSYVAAIAGKLIVNVPADVKGSL